MGQVGQQHNLGLQGRLLSIARRLQFPREGRQGTAEIRCAPAGLQLFQPTADEGDPATLAGSGVEAEHGFQPVIEDIQRDIILRTEGIELCVGKFEQPGPGPGPLQAGAAIHEQGHPPPGQVAD